MSNLQDDWIQVLQRPSAYKVRADECSASTHLQNGEFCMGDIRYRTCAVCRHNRTILEEFFCPQCEKIDEFVLPMLENFISSWMRQVDYKDTTERQPDFHEQDGLAVKMALSDYRDTRRFILENLDAVIDSIESGSTRDMKIPRRVLTVIDQARKSAPSAVCRYLRMVKDGSIQLVDAMAYPQPDHGMILQSVSGLQLGSG